MDVMFDYLDLIVNRVRQSKPPAAQWINGATSGR